MELQITVYDENDNVVKECNANTIDIRYGQIAAIMELLNVEEVEDTVTLLKKVGGAWKQLTKILTKVFPEMEEEDWENVRIAELLPVLVMILKNTFMEMAKIPKSKNA
jgi:hypothetical protein